MKVEINLWLQDAIIQSVIEHLIENSGWSSPRLENADSYDLEFSDDEERTDKYGYAEYPSCRMTIEEAFKIFLKEKK